MTLEMESYVIEGKGTKVKGHTLEPRAGKVWPLSTSKGYLQGNSSIKRKNASMNDLIKQTRISMLIIVYMVYFIH